MIGAPDIQTTGTHPVRYTVLDPPRGEGARPTNAWVVTLGYAAWLDPFELQRFAMLASAWGRRLIVVETPGTGGRTRLTPHERRALVRGDFSPLSVRLLAAARAADPDVPVTGVLGYSMGTSVAAAMGRVAPSVGIRFDTAVLVEPVAVQRWSVRRLLRANAAEEARVDEFLEATAGVPGAVAPSDRTPGAPRPAVRRADQWLLANAMRRARLGDDLAAAPNALDILVVRGADSALCDACGVERLAARMRAAGHRTEVLTVPGAHGIWHSLPAVSSIADEVGRWSRW